MTGRGVWGIWESQTGISGVTINQISKKWYKFHVGYHKVKFQKIGQNFTRGSSLTKVKYYI